MAIDDLALLREYAQKNSQPAFTALVSRYVNLVYSVAFRRLGDRHLAEDATQATFLILAQKAGSLKAGTIVSAWLCRTARFVASNAQSSRLRRKHHEQKLAMRSPAKNSEAEAWEQIGPCLDTALAQLGKKDHDAVVLRFFEGMSVKQCAAALATSEEAARKRTNRALAKLRKFFAKHGVVLAIPILSKAIAANSVQAAPAGLAASVSMLVNGAAAPASTLALVQGGLKLMAWAKMKLAMAVAASALLAGGTAGLVLANKAWADDTTETGEIKLELKSSGIGQVMRQFSALILDVDSEKPSGIKKLPSDLVAPRFGKLKLGPKESAKRFYIVWDAPPGKPNRLLIDTNGNGDLTDDEDVKWQLRPNPRVESYAGQAAFNVAYGEESAPLTVKFYSMEGKLFYYRDYGRVGQVTLGGKAYQALLDDNMTTGDFRTGPTSSHRGTMLLLDQAGRFDVTRPAFDVERPFKVDGVSYEVTGMTASGDSFRIVKSKQDGDNKAQK